jgi:hypothetical protein
MTDTPSNVVPDETRMPSEVYKDATDNLIYLKREQVQIAYYTWLLLAAVYILSRNHQSVLAAIVLSVGSIVVGVFSITFIWRLHSSMGKFRSRLSYIYETYFTEGQRKALHLYAGRHYFVTFLLSFIAGVASVFTFAVIARRFIYTLPFYLEVKASLRPYLWRAKDFLLSV